MLVITTKSTKLTCLLVFMFNMLKQNSICLTFVAFFIPIEARKKGKISWAEVVQVRNHLLAEIHIQNASRGGNPEKMTVGEARAGRMVNDMLVIQVRFFPRGDEACCRNN